MRFALFVLAVMLAGAPAIAQTELYDPGQLPSFHGKVEAYILSPRDDLDGFYLEDGIEVHISARLSSELAYAVKPGDAVTVYGLRARSVPMVQALAVVNDGTGVRVSDIYTPGWPSHTAPPREKRYLEARGRIKRLTHGPEGDLNGAMLDDGTFIRFPDNLTMRQADCLVPGRDITATGTGLAGALGKVLETRSIGLGGAAPGSASTQARCPLVGASDRAANLPLLNPPPGNSPPDKPPG